MSINESEPISVSVALGYVVQTGVTLAALLWPQRLPQDVQVAIISFSGAVIALLVAYFGRKGSTPIANPVLTAGTPVTTPDGGAALVTPQ